MKRIDKEQRSPNQYAELLTKRVLYHSHLPNFYTVEDQMNK